MTIVSYLEFRSQVDRWLIWLFFLVSLLLAISWILVLVDSSSSPATKVFVSLIASVLLPFILWVYWGTKYRLTETHLLVRSGPFSRKILLDSITEVEPVRSLQSCPALSRNRFLIRYDRFATVMISPEDRACFLKELAVRAPHLIWQDQKLVSYS